MKLINLARFKNNKGLVAELEAITEMARKGDFTGAAVVLKIAPKDHRIGFFGDFDASSSEALQATMLLECRLRGELGKVYGGSI